MEQARDGGVPRLCGFGAGADSQRRDGFRPLTRRPNARGPAGANPDPIDLMIGDGGTISPRGVVRLEPVPVGPDDPPKVFSFFATAGSVSSLRSTNRTSTGQPAPVWVEWPAPAPAPVAPVRLWAALRHAER